MKSSFCETECENKHLYRRLRHESRKTIANKISIERLREIQTEDRRIITEIEKEKEKWIQVWTGNDPAPRYWFASGSLDKMTTPLGSGMLIHGGKTIQNNVADYFGDMQWFDIDTKEWTSIEQGNKVPENRSGHAMSFVDDKACIFGGTISYKDESGEAKTKAANDLHCFNFKETGDQKWDTLEGGTFKEDQHPVERSNHAMVTYNDSFVVFGGATNDGVPLSDVWQYNITEDKWEKWEFDEEEPTPSNRYSFGYSLVKHAPFGEYLAIFGGYISDSSSESSVLGDVWVLDLGKKKWKQVIYDGPHFTRAFMGMDSIGTKLWATGGYSRVNYNFRIQGFIFNDLLTIDLKDFIENTNPNVDINPRWYIAPDISTTDLYRMKHRMIATNNGELLTYGGRFQVVYPDVWAVNNVTALQLRETVSSDFVEDSISMTPAIVAFAIFFGFCFLCMCTISIMRMFSCFNREGSFDDPRVPSVPQGIAKSVLDNLPQIKYVSKDNRQDMCVICLEPYKEDDLLTQLPCYHNFHPDCIREWLGDHPDCPMCKRRADNATITPTSPSPRTADRQPLNTGHQQQQMFNLSDA